MARAQGARSQMAVAFETTYGTAPANGYYQMPFARSGLGAEQPLLDSELLGYGRDPLDPELDAITVDGDITVPIDLEAWGVWLKATFGDPTTTGSDPYTHVFTSGAWDLPGLAIETGMPEVPHYAMVTGAKVDQVSWEMSRSGLLTATLAMVGQGEAVGTTTGAGTPATWTLDRFGHFNGQVTQGGSEIGNVVSAQITYANKLDRVEVVRNDGLIDGADPSMAMLSGQVVVRFASQTLLNQAINGTASALKFAYSKGAGKSFELEAHRVFLPRPKIEVDGPAGVQATFDWQAEIGRAHV